MGIEPISISLQKRLALPWFMHPHKKSPYFSELCFNNVYFLIIYISALLQEIISLPALSVTAMFIIVFIEILSLFFNKNPLNRNREGTNNIPTISGVNANI